MSENRPFKCKFLLLWTKEPLTGVTLADARIEQLGNRTFIAGEYYFNEGVTDARAGLTAWVPVEDVISLTEFPSRESILAASAEWKAAREKDKQ